MPTEINSSWIPSGDDAIYPNFLWMEHEYDWKGRPTREVNTDGVTDKLFSYNGCGCAGGQVTTIEGELVPRDDQPTVNGRRTQKVYADILGRTFKTETLNWNGSVYSSNTITFDGADRPTFARQFEGSAFLNNPHQTTIATYDGFGRLKTQHRPQQDNGAVTTYNYLPDGRMQNMIDARGAITNYTYLPNTVLNAGQLSQVSYTVPNGSAIPVTPSVNYTYNNLGMRTSMIDGVGNVNYVYNNLGQMISENRQFTDTLADAPSGGFKLEYTYAMNGQLKSLKDPYGQQINYGFDKVGRLNNVVGSTPFQGITNYATTPTYNARGILTHLNYGNGVETNITTFNNKLQATNFEVKKGTTEIIKKNYEFYDDGSLRYSQDHKDARFDRLYKYDFIGQIKEAKTGLEARGGTVPPLDVETQIPYRQSYNYNVYGELTERNNLHWGKEGWYGTFNLSYTYQNGRMTNPGYTYDADGRNLSSWEGNNGTYSTYDASGSMSRFVSWNSSDIYRYNDGNGRESKRKTVRWIIEPNGSEYWSTTPEFDYYIRSSLLGNEVVTEVNKTGKKQKTIVRAGGSELATQGVFNSLNNVYESLMFRHIDASGASIRSTDINGNESNSTDDENAPAELDGLGGNVGLSTPYIEPIFTQPSPDDWSYLYNESPMRVNGQIVKATIDGMSVPISLAMRRLHNGSAIPAALEPYQHLLGFRFEDQGLGIFTASYILPRNDENIPLPPIDQIRKQDVRVDIGTWWFGAALVGQTKDKETTRKQELKEFLKKNKNCKKALKKLGLDINKEFKDKNFLDVTEGSDVANSTLRELGMDLSGAPEGFKADVKIGETKDAFAQSVVGTNKILIFQSFYEQNGSQRGVTIIHEILHSFFNIGNHVDLSAKLGFNIKHDFKEIINKGVDITDRKGKIIEPAKQTILKFDANEQSAIDAINSWIANNCSIPK